MPFDLQAKLDQYEGTLLQRLHKINLTQADIMQMSMEEYAKVRGILLNHAVKDWHKMQMVLPFMPPGWPDDPH